ncbi:MULTISPECIES: hypothetical protein [Bradyrhizobium]|uniref:hypothetical protein n=1 Tax=Bradyrhizobium TaxID=374 RepID=UPI001CE2837F|nr:MULTISPECIES: hypothetical protein [Bradyrhizobium]MCA6102127.1 hypothetical protein [Bradyrhizobium australafricanum]MCC8969641.1 hypothetical protein [Bradyrhizobium brasilense]
MTDNIVHDPRSDKFTDLKLLRQGSSLVVKLYPVTLPFNVTGALSTRPVPALTNRANVWRS